MKFNLEKDIVFFDIESTGLNVLRDRILQIAFVKYTREKEEPEELSMLINPGIPISEESMSIHGITPDMIRNKPTFQQVAQQLFEFIGDADLAGYNSDRFDIPMLLEEFARAGIDFKIDHRNCVDVQKIFYKMEPRTLKAALKVYCGKELENAHDALADAKATVDILKGQLDRYEGVSWVDGDGFSYPNAVKNDMKALAEFTGDSRSVDATNRLKYDTHGEIVFNFGKYIGKRVKEVFRQDPQYYNWIIQKDFSTQVKQAVKKIMSENESNKGQ